MSTLFQGTPARARILYQNDTDLYIKLTFSPPAVGAQERAPMDIAVAMDISGSMSGDKIHTARQALTKLLAQLGARDHLSIVAFDDRVSVRLPRSKIDAEGKAKASQVINSLRPCGGTNLSGGVLATLAQLKESAAGSGDVRRTLVFTDGQANQGITHPDELFTAVDHYRGGIPLSTFGIGSDHNPSLLNRLAIDGSFYFINSTDKILTTLGQEFGGLVSTFAQNVRLHLHPHEGVEVVEVLNDLHTAEEEHVVMAANPADGGRKYKDVTVFCDDLLAETAYSVIVKLKVGSRSHAHPRDTAILDVSYSFFDLVQKDEIKGKTAIKVRFVKKGQEDASDCVEVAEAVGLQLLGKASREAEQFATRGDFAGARQVYSTVQDYTGNIHSSVGAGLNQMAGAIPLAAYGNKAVWDQHGTHMVNAISKGASRQRAALGGAKIGNVDFDQMYATRAQLASSVMFAASEVPEESK